MSFTVTVAGLPGSANNVGQPSAPARLPVMSGAGEQEREHRSCLRPCAPATDKSPGPLEMAFFICSVEHRLTNRTGTGFGKARITSRAHRDPANALAAPRRLSRAATVEVLGIQVIMARPCACHDRRPWGPRGAFERDVRGEVNG